MDQKKQGCHFNPFILVYGYYFGKLLSLSEEFEETAAHPSKYSTKERDINGIANIVVMGIEHIERAEVCGQCIDIGREEGGQSDKRKKKKTQATMSHSQP